MIVERKRPDLLLELDVLLAQLNYELISTDNAPGTLVTDPKDQPVLNAAIANGTDIIISGDKHFLQLELDRPITMTAAQFWQMAQNQKQKKH